MKHLRQYIRCLILEQSNQALGFSDLDKLLNNVDSILESSTFFDDIADLLLENVLTGLSRQRKGRARPTSRRRETLLDEGATAENILQAIIITKSLSRYMDPYNFRGYNPDHDPMGFKEEIPSDSIVTTKATKEAIFDRILTNPGYLETLETLRGYQSFAKELVRYITHPENSDPALIPVYEMTETKNIENFKHAFDLWDMMK